MAIAFRSLTSITYASRTNTTLAAPSGLTNGDILVAGFITAKAAGAPTPTPPAGFTAFGTETTVTDLAGFNGKLYIFWKRAASESGSYTFTHASCTSTAVLMAYSGALVSGTPFGATSNNTGSGPNGTTSTGLSITTTAANSQLLWISHDWEGFATLSPPSGMAERFDGFVYSADQLIASAGATGNRTQTNGNDAGATEQWAVRMVELLAATASAYTLAANAGSHAVTGSAAGTLRGSRLDAQPATLAVAGTDAGLLQERSLAASGGACSVTGTAAGLLAAHVLPASGGACSVTGSDATLTKSAQNILPAQPGSVAVTGTDAGLARGLRLVADAGSWNITGTAAILARGRGLAANGAAIGIVGGDAGLSWGHELVLVAQGGAVVIAGSAANLSPGNENTVTPPARWAVVAAESRIAATVRESRTVRPLDTLAA